MYLSRLHYGLAISCILTFTLWLASCGGAQVQHPQTSGKGQDIFYCGNKTVLVVPTDGTAPKDIYLCEGDILTWDPNHHTFQVSFPNPNKYPFQGNPTTFQNDPQDADKLIPSPPAKRTGSLLVYHYNIIVDTLPVTDPQVVGGGYHTN